MARMSRIRTPLRQHVRRARYQLLPVVVFGVAVGAAGMLWQHHALTPTTVGEVQAVRIAIRSDVGGFLKPLNSGSLRLFDRVVAGQTLAQLDDEAARQGLVAVRHEVGRLVAELNATAARLGLEEGERRHDSQAESRRLAVDMERYRLDVLAIKTALQAEQLQARWLSDHVAMLEKAKATGAASVWETEEARLRRDQSRQTVDGLSEQLAQAESDLGAAHERARRHSLGDMGETDTFLEPLRRARAAQEARAAELAIRIDAMSIRAPISGTIVSILRHPGQAVQPGEDILTIAADAGQHIVAYVREDQRLRPEIGMEAAIYRRGGPGQPVPAKVLRVGPQVEEVPPHQRRDPAQAEWGLPVMISLPEDVFLRPGELVDIGLDAG